MRRSTAITMLLITGIVAIVGVALVLDSRRSVSGDRFVGSDSAATSQIEKDNPDYEPWFTSVFTPSSGEVESGLFAIQAALGGMALGYCLGALRGRRRAEAIIARASSPTPGQP
ncbi:energy-coupling factor ABC transporter substrate-binding protein [Aeromicrobium sp. A1-2]|uniref:energy-coupling factor ABC transporter substrate-binding protein n=1 Tax=Aeromicrobium sp. A1-2 TaxID=2107713 RepID=UPI000E4DDF80|nr:energy-coupling factor ABC transporter substrate-binding protein [Aeromicrobium sp. A1-2]AXT83800.1 energy-coupling factor ABC transporter substrate-binding protein [Aeromicrobium sp. A1-2]